MRASLMVNSPLRTLAPLSYDVIPLLNNVIIESHLLTMTSSLMDAILHTNYFRRHRGGPVPLI